VLAAPAALVVLFEPTVLADSPVGLRKTGQWLSSTKWR